MNIDFVEVISLLILLLPFFCSSLCTCLVKAAMSQKNSLLLLVINSVVISLKIHKKYGKLKLYFSYENLPLATSGTTESRQPLNKYLEDKIGVFQRNFGKINISKRKRALFIHQDFGTIENYKIAGLTKTYLETF